MATWCCLGICSTFESEVEDSLLSFYRITNQEKDYNQKLEILHELLKAAGSLFNYLYERLIDFDLLRYNRLNENVKNHLSTVKKFLKYW